MKVANTLAFALGLLALHPDIQEKFYQSIRDAIPDGHIPVSGALLALCSPLIRPDTDLRAHTKARLRNGHNL